MTCAVGSQVAPKKDSLGCSLTALVRDHSLASAGLRLLRKSSAHTAPVWVETPESDRGLLLGVSLSGGHRRYIREQGVMRCHEFIAGSTYLRNFAESYAAEITTPFDFLLIEMPLAVVARAAEVEADRVEMALPTVRSEADPVLFHLAQAMLPALERPGSASALVIDQITFAMQAHLLTRFAGLRTGPQTRERRLSRVQEIRAKELLLADLRGTLLIEDLAVACGLSRSVFMRAFKATVGTTPYQWLLGQRIERAKMLLATTRAPIAEIAARAGFADQSHLTRAFTRAVGASPGAWRERA